MTYSFSPKKLLLLPMLLPLSLALSGCSHLNPPAAAGVQAGTDDITIFSINDFHGNLQASQPVPYLYPKADPQHAGQTVNAPAGGYAYLVSKLKQRRAAVGASVLVGGGDLIGASPLGSAMLKDEPVIEALNRIDLAATAVGNHEFDKGPDELQRRIAGRCPDKACSFVGFQGARYTYLGANVHLADSPQPWLPPYLIRQVGNYKIGFIGAVTADVPNLVAGNAVAALRFEDEATAVNRYVPELKRQGVDTIVLLIHEGANYKGNETDPSYRCEGLQGPIIDIVKKLDPAISLVVSAHSHQGYTCKIDGRLVVQGRSYGAFLTESTLSFDKQTRQLVKTAAVNHLIDQASITPDPEALQLVGAVAQQTAALRQRALLTLERPLLKDAADGQFDSALGNLIADAQLDLARHQGQADLAMMNDGGIRSDLPSGAKGGPVTLTFGDLYAVQPFGNGIIKMQLSGRQILQLLQQQWQNRSNGDIRKLYVSAGFSYRWNNTEAKASAISDVRLNGQPIQPLQMYTVVVNSFLADGGDGFSVFKQGRNRQLLGSDLDAMENYILEQGNNISHIPLNRVGR